MLRNYTLLLLLILSFGGLGWLTEGCGPASSACDGVCKEAGPDDANIEQPPPEPVIETTGPRKPAVNLLDHTQWKVVSADRDPFVQKKKPTHKCNHALGQKLEDNVLEIDTNHCNYITLEQMSQTEVREGEQLQFAMWHLELYAQTPGEAFVAITINGQTVWEKTIPVPHKAEFYDPKWTPQGSIPKGARIVFHLHNHGANTWKIHSLTTGVPF